MDDVSFTARPGRITGFLGPDGAGRSTTLRVLVGLTPPGSGTARVLGRRCRDPPNPGSEVGVLLDASAVILDEPTASTWTTWATSAASRSLSPKRFLG